MIHAANPQKSIRLALTLQALEDFGECSTLTLSRHANTVAAHTAIAELRQHGYLINCRRVRNTYFYSLIGRQI